MRVALRPISGILARTFSLGHNIQIANFRSGRAFSTESTEATEAAEAGDTPDAASSPRRRITAAYAYDLGLNIQAARVTSPYKLLQVLDRIRSAPCAVKRQTAMRAVLDVLLRRNNPRLLATLLWSKQFNPFVRVEALGPRACAAVLQAALSPEYTVEQQRITRILNAYRTRRGVITDELRSIIVTYYEARGFAVPDRIAVHIASTPEERSQAAEVHFRVLLSRGSLPSQGVMLKRLAELRRDGGFVTDSLRDLIVNAYEERGFAPPVRVALAMSDTPDALAEFCATNIRAMFRCEKPIHEYQILKALHMLKVRGGTITDEVRNTIRDEYRRLNLAVSDRVLLAISEDPQEQAQAFAGVLRTILARRGTPHPELIQRILEAATQRGIVNDEIRAIVAQAGVPLVGYAPLKPPPPPPTKRSLAAARANTVLIAMIHGEGSPSPRRVCRTLMRMKRRRLPITDELRTAVIAAYDARGVQIPDRVASALDEGYGAMQTCIEGLIAVFAHDAFSQQRIVRRLEDLKRRGMAVDDTVRDLVEAGYEQHGVAVPPRVVRALKNRSEDRMRLHTRHIRRTLAGKTRIDHGMVSRALIAFRRRGIRVSNLAATIKRAYLRRRITMPPTTRRALVEKSKHRRSKNRDKLPAFLLRGYLPSQRVILRKLHALEASGGAVTDYIARAIEDAYSQRDFDVPERIQLALNDAVDSEVRACMEQLREMFARKSFPKLADITGALRELRRRGGKVTDELRDVVYLAHEQRGYSMSNTLRLALCNDPEDISSMGADELRTMLSRKALPPQKLIINMLQSLQRRGASVTDDVREAVVAGYTRRNRNIPVDVMKALGCA
ncbi:hypothetical protein EXIGLDRAFT_200010 [Exidia glandulosa HHB12029]|uniref:Uncharacterized protein n=1 Tax=Exidia glandulosa HHB12029 TaxID=1314781 RepID=A0A165ESH9_EXIGL|nr:hypothetical protein EXIGLDRAFT_200010 [Exidia glandulosa HHB12029]